MTPAAEPSPAAPGATDPRRLDEAVARVRDGARAWARAPLPEKRALALELLAGMERVAPRLVRAACAAKGIPLGTPPEGDEWLAGVYPVLRILRETAESLDGLARRGNTPVGRFGESEDGHATVRVFPAGWLDRILFPFVTAEVHFRAGVTPRDVDARRGRFHKAPDHDGRVCAVLGAGNVNSIAPADVLTKLFNEGKACVLKMNPVNAYLGPFLEEAFAPAIRRGVLAIVHGGKDAGGHLAHHPGVDELHLTGATATHDAIVWGPPGPEREARLARDEPLLTKEITSELGDVSPVLVAPGPWDERTLAFQAECVAGMMTQNGSFNCLAARLIVTPSGWRLRDRFLDLVERGLRATPARRGWYPGAAERLARLVEGRPAVRAVAGEAGTLPWTLVTGLDAETDDPAFTTESFCPALVETSVGSEDPLEFLDAATRFANERLPGTLSAAILAPPRLLADPATGAAARRAVRALRYGTVAVNGFSAYAFALGTTPWGAHPGHTRRDIRSGRGFVHNSRMLEDVEKTVVWFPARAPVKPPYLPSHRTLHRLGPHLVALEGSRRLSGLPAIFAHALRG